MTRQPGTTRQPWYQRFPTDELADTLLLTCEEYGLLQRVRDMCWNTGGLRMDEDFFKRLSRSFQLSRYKLKKLWPVIEKFFTEIDGVLFYEPDERKRGELIDISTKRKIAGEKGAFKRWANGRTEPDVVPESDNGKPMANAIDPRVANAWPPEPEPEPYTRGVPTAAGSTVGVNCEEAGAVGPPQLSENAAQELSPDQYAKLLITRCVQMGLQIPDQVFIERLREKFPTIHPTEFPVFHKQETAGLWLTKSIKDIELEIRRCRESPPRKTADQEVRARAMLAKQISGGKP